MNITNIPLESTTLNENTPIKEIFFTFEKSSMDELVNITEQLNTLCLEFNPYTSTVDSDVLKIIKELKLESFLDNPFTFTNVLLQLLDKTEHLLKTKNH